MVVSVVVFVVVFVVVTILFFYFLFEKAAFHLPIKQNVAFIRFLLCLNYIKVSIFHLSLPFFLL